MATAGSKETEELKAQIKTLSDDVGVLTKMLKELAESTASDLGEDVRAKVEEMAERTGKLKRDASAKARAEADSIVRHISEKPMQSALIALLVGIIFGAMTRR